MEDRRLMSVSLLTSPQIAIGGPTIDTAGKFIPPDPSGASGPNALVTAVNDQIDFNDKGGGSSSLQSLESFFTSLSPSHLGQSHVVYDQYNGRFLVSSLEGNGSRILVAVSQQNSPYNGWYFSAINSQLTINGKTCTANLPMIVSGSNAVYITANMFATSDGTFQGTRLWIINKTPFYSGGGMSVAVYDPAGTVGEPDYFLQPAQMFGTAPGNTGTFLVATAYASSTSESLITDTNGDNYLDVIRVDNPLGTPTFSDELVGAGAISNGTLFGKAPQPGAQTQQYLTDGDFGATSAVWRNNSLYATNTINPLSGPDAGQATAHWYQVDTSSLAALSMSQQGNAGGEDLASGTYTFYPAITVNKAGAVALSFDASGSNLYLGAYYTARAATDGPGTLRATQTLATGTALYYNVAQGTIQPNLWGHYSSVSVDPSDDLTFWSFNDFALSQGSGGSGRWGTQMGSFAFSSELGVWNSSGGGWSLDSNGDRKWDGGDTFISSFGGGSEVPVVGDWTGTGVKRIGVYDPSTGTWYLDLNGNGVWDGPSGGDMSYSFGGGSEIPVVGRWNGGTADELGVYDPVGRVFYLDYNGNKQWDGPSGGDVSFSFNPVTGGTLVPVAGDWNGDGKTDVGVWEQSSGVFYLDSNGSWSWNTGDASFAFGTFTGPSDHPVVGDWNGDGVSDVGIYNSDVGQFYLDSNSDHQWALGDPTISGWGGSTYKPVVVS